MLLLYWSFFNLISFALLDILTLYSACQNGKQMVQEGALTALASVADSSQVLRASRKFFILLLSAVI